MKDIFQQLYNGLLRFIPVKKYFRYEYTHKGNFPKVGFLDDSQKSKLESVLGLEIKQIEIFEQSLLHRSYLQVLSNPEFFSNERLEFLGDSILGMVISDYLFSLHSTVEEGDLTKMRSWLVNKKTLSLCAQKLKLEEFIKLSFSAEKSLKGGSDSILADALEAVIAAIYLDSGFDCAKKFVIDIMLPVMMSKNIMTDSNYKSILLEAVQALGKSSPTYEVIEEAGPDHDKEFTVGVFIESELIAVGSGKSKKKAEQFAAQKAFEDRFLKTNLTLDK